MISKSILSPTAFGSVIGTQSALNPKNESHKRSLFADLLLTALIDAFSILVIFLLMNFSSTGEILFMSKSVELPQASSTDILERNTVVRFEEGKFFIENKELENQDLLIQELLTQRKEWSEKYPTEDFKGIVTVQADKRTKYENLNSIVLAMAHAGYSDIRFAVVNK